MTVSVIKARKRGAAASPSAFYLHNRQDGRSHDAAIEEVCRAYGYIGQEGMVEEQLARFRHDYENPAPPVTAEPEPEPEVDALDGVKAEAQAHLIDLEAQLARLASVMFGDDEHAKREAEPELRAVESEITATKGQLKIISLVPAEREREAREAAEEEERVAREKARKEDIALGKRLPAARAAIDAAAAELGRTIALHSDLAERKHAAGRRSRGEEDGFHGFHQHPRYTGAVRHGLSQAGVLHAVDFGPLPGPDIGPLTGEAA